MKKLSSDAGPRGQLSAWQRWEMDSFDRSAPAPNAAADAAAAREAEAAAARAAAIAAGRAEGYAAGLAAAAGEAAQLRTLLAALATTADVHEQCVADAILDLALALARRIAGDALAVRRELIIPAVIAALAQLPPSAQRIGLQLNPDDLRVVQSFLGSEPERPACALAADPAIVAGGCRVETEQSSVDATVQTRWHRLVASLGRSDDWLEPA